MFRGFRRIGKVGGVSFEEGGVGKEAIKWEGGIVDIGLFFLPPNKGLVSEVINVVWVIVRGKDYRGLRCGWVRIGRPGRSVGW